MTVYRLPERVRALLFDVDGTLYTNPDYGRHQTEVLIRELASSRGWSVERARAELERSKADIFAATGRKTSLGNAMAALGVDLATSVQWRSSLIKPELFVRPDAELRAALRSLAAAGLSLAIVTNNPRSVGLATLTALGVADLFPVAVGLDDTLVSKPAPQPYLEAARRCGVEPAACVSIGDRYDVDLAEPLALGMGAVLVNGAADVYELPALLRA